jgi:hypothetical protein
VVASVDQVAHLFQAFDENERLLHDVPVWILNVFELVTTNLSEMPAAVSTLFRMFVAIAVSLGSLMLLPVRDCGVRAVQRRCECCAHPGAAACCAAPENRTPPQQPAAPSAPLTEQWQPAALAQRQPLAMPPPVDAFTFPMESGGLRAGAAGRCFQSLNCVWRV